MPTAFSARTNQDGDKVFLFGFSRGAYTVRALAGLVHLVGLLPPDQANVADYALTAYKRSSEKDDLSIAWNFGKVLSTREARIHFMGLWDTVASVIVPRPDRFFWPSLQTLPHTRTNKSVKIVRHAIAIDERRAMFRPNEWMSPQPYVENPFAKDAPYTPQDTKLVWFAGVHADIGGGYPEGESGLAKIPLCWMIDEAVEHGLDINPATYRKLARGEEGEGHDQYVPPDPAAKLHNSLTGAWWPLEFWPKRRKWRKWPKRPSFLGLYLPLAEPRLIPGDATLHPSVAERMALRPDYRPINLPNSRGEKPA